MNQVAHEEVNNKSIITKKRTPKKVSQDIWSLSDLKRLPADDIFDRIEQIEYQSFSYQCRLWWALRQSFKTHIEYGIYINDLMQNPYHAECIPTQQTRNNMIHAGEFMEKHRIGDLNQAKIRKLSMYHLSTPSNKQVADDILKKIRGKNTSPNDVKKMVEDAKEALRIEVEQSNVIEHVPELTGVVRNIQVRNGVALEEKRLLVNDKDQQVDNVISEVSDDTHNPRYALLRQLAQLDTKNISIEDAKAEHSLFVEQYKRSSVKERIEFLKAFRETIDHEIKSLSNAMYPRR